MVLGYRWWRHFVWLRRVLAVGSFYFCNNFYFVVVYYFVLYFYYEDKLKLFSIFLSCCFVLDLLWCWRSRFWDSVGVTGIPVRVV